MKTKGHASNLSDYQKWSSSNHFYLQTCMSWLRLVLRRRVLWLRQQWQHDPMQNYRGQLISDAQSDWALTGEDLDEERRFYDEDHTVKRITQAIEAADHELKEHSTTLVEAGTPCALDQLTQLFGLDSFDRAILILCLAPELDPAFENLYAYVQDDVTRKYVTPYLAYSLFATDSNSNASLKYCFRYDSPLTRFKLIEWEDSSRQSHVQASCPIRISPRIAEYLQGINHLDNKAASFLEPVSPSDALPQSYEKTVNKLLTLFELNDESTSLSPLNLTGPALRGKRDVASRMCTTLGIDLIMLKPNWIEARGVQPHELARLLERECMLLPAILFIDVDELDVNDPSRSQFEGLIERLNTFFIVASRDPWPAERETLTIPIPKLNASEQSFLWNQQLKKYGLSLNGHVDAIIEQFDFESNMINKAITAAKSSIRMKGGKSSKLTIEDIWSACREQSENNLGNLAQKLEPCYSWDDIVLPEKTRKQLQDIAAQVAHRSQVYEEWGYGAKLVRGRGISALFSGPTGTGKTMAAEILADHLKLDLYRIDLSAVVSKYIGETEKNLRKVFDAAEQSGAILFFDEADALFGKRSEVKDSHDRYANIEINYLLQRMEEYRGLAILATNMKSLLDTAFLRRLRFHVKFPFPNETHRKLIWKKSFPTKEIVGNLDYDFLSRLEISGGNIKNISLNAAFLAAVDGQIIGMDHILLATKREYEKIGRMILESEFGPFFREVTK